MERKIVLKLYFSAGSILHPFSLSIPATVGTSITQIQLKIILPGSNICGPLTRILGNLRWTGSLEGVREMKTPENEK